MSTYRNPGPRPAIATFFGWTSLLWAMFMLGWVLFVIGAAVLVGAASWLGGPVLGFAGTAIGAIVVLYSIVSSLLSFLLLYAGYRILRGDPAGVSLLRTWAGISLIYDALILLFTGGFAATSWAAVLYAVAVLYFTRPAEIDDRWVGTPGGPSPYHAKPKSTLDPDF